MSFIGKIVDVFKKHEPAEIEAKKLEPAPPSKARDDFYATLKAQEEAKSEELVMGGIDDMTEAERQEIAKKIVPVNVFEQTKIVEKGEDDGLVDTQDAAAAGEIMSRRPDDGRYANLWGTFARINPRILRHFISRAFIGHPACAVLGTHEIINPCCNMPGKDAMASGFKLTCDSSDHKQGDQHLMGEADWLKKLVKISDRMGLKKACVKLAYHTRLYGIGVAIPRVTIKEGHSMEEEYDPSLVEPKSFKGFSVVAPTRYTWDLTEESLYDPLSEYYMNPEFLRLFDAGDTRIHRSWLVISLFCEVDDDLKGTYMWGGAPLSQFLYERVFCADKLANEIVALAMSKRTVVKDGNMKAYIADPKKANRELERWNGYRNNMSIAVKEPGESITQLETSLADLQPLSAQQYQYAAAIAGIPVTKLLKNVPSGLQATGQYEQDEYDQTLEDVREDIFKPLIEEFFELYIASNYPDREDLHVTVEFNPIHSPKANEIQQLESQASSKVCQLLQNNAITVTEARAMLKSSGYVGFSSIADVTPEILVKMEKMKDPEEQQKMQMKMQQEQMKMQGATGSGMPGMPGAGAPGQEQPNPEFEQNKTMFQDALKEVVGEKPQDGEQPSAGDDQQGENVPQGEEKSPEGMFAQAEKQVAE